VREGQKSEWVREKDRERRERGGREEREWSGKGGQEPEGETHIQNPKKHGLTFSLAS
jgi:hypothetical protein